MGPETRLDNVYLLLLTFVLLFYQYNTVGSYYVIIRITLSDQCVMLVNLGERLGEGW